MQYLDDDGSVVYKVSTNDNNEAFSYLNTSPTKDSSSDYLFSFLKWEKVSEENGVLIYKAVYEKCTRGLTIEGSTVVNYGGESKDIVIPSYWNGNTITTIGQSAFEKSRGLTSVILPDNLSTVEMFAFSNNSVNGFPEMYYYGALENWLNITDKGYLYSNLHFFFEHSQEETTTIVIPETLTAIPENAFNYAGSILNVRLSENITSIGYSAFYKCSSLESINLEEGLLTIDSYAFGYCSSLTSLVIPKSVTSIGDSAFCKCSSLATLTLPFAESILSLFGTLATDIPTSLKTIIISEGCTEISSVAFKNCSSLTTIVLPDSITKIGAGAFSGCSALVSFTLPASLTEIGQSAFASCSSLNDTYYYGSLENWFSLVGRSGLRSGIHLFLDDSGVETTAITIPETMTEIPDYAFTGCTHLKTVVIPSTVTSIGNYAFSNCTSLETVVIAEGVNTINTYCFKSCTSLKNIVIPGSVTTLDGYAFYDCTSLESVILNDGLKTLGAGVFLSCTSLKSLTIPNSVTTINARVLSGCNSLEYLSVPFVGSTSSYAGSNYLAGFLFEMTKSSVSADWDASVSYNSGYSTNYYKFAIPSTLKTLRVTKSIEIRYYVFGGFKSLENLIIEGKCTLEASSGTNWLRNCDSLKNIELGCSFVSFSSYHSYSSLFPNTINYSEFDNCLYLGNADNPYRYLVIAKDPTITECIIHQDCEKIMGGAFSECSGLTTIYYYNTSPSCIGQADNNFKNATKTHYSE